LARYTGGRVYVLNGTSCRIVVIEEHDGYAADPGEMILVKPSLIDRSPTMMIRAGSSIWFGGLHFSLARLEVRERQDVLIPPSLLRSTRFGSSLTYQLTDRGQLVIANPTGEAAIVQPQGLPLTARPASAATECAHARDKV
jgi:hypothetical protein